MKFSLYYYDSEQYLFSERYNKKYDIKIDVMFCYLICSRQLSAISKK